MIANLLQVERIVVGISRLNWQELDRRVVAAVGYAAIWGVVAIAVALAAPDISQINGDARWIAASVQAAMPVVMLWRMATLSIGSSKAGLSEGEIGVIACAEIVRIYAIGMVGMALTRLVADELNMGLTWIYAHPKEGGLLVLGVWFAVTWMRVLRGIDGTISRVSSYSPSDDGTKKETQITEDEWVELAEHISRLNLEPEPNDVRQLRAEKAHAIVQKGLGKKTWRAYEGGYSMLEMTGALAVVMACAAGPIVSIGDALIVKIKTTPTSSIQAAEMAGHCKGLCAEIIKQDKIAKAGVLHD